MVHVTSPLPFQGWFAIYGLALATVNLSTKFKVSIYLHSLRYYEDIKGDKNVETVLFRVVRVTQGH